jgi:hypothetical protein
MNWKSQGRVDAQRFGPMPWIWKLSGITILIIAPV